MWATSKRLNFHKRDGAPGTIRTCGLHLRRVALYPAELRVPETRNDSLLITPVDDALTRLEPVRVTDDLTAFTCRRLRRSFRRGGRTGVATPPVDVDPKTTLPLTPSTHDQNRPTKRRPALTVSPSEGAADGRPLVPPAGGVPRGRGLRSGLTPRRKRHRLRLPPAFRDPPGPLRRRRGRP